MSFPRRGDWYCGSCNFHNFRHRIVCASCNLPKSQDSKQHEELIWECGTCQRRNNWSPHFCRECLQTGDQYVTSCFFVSFSCIRTNKSFANNRLVAIGAVLSRIDSENPMGHNLASTSFCTAVGERSTPNFDEKSLDFWKKNETILDRIDESASPDNVAVRFVRWLRDMSDVFGPFERNFFFVAKNPAFAVSEINAALHGSEINVSILDTFFDGMVVLDPHEQFRSLTPSEKHSIETSNRRNKTFWPQDQATYNLELFFCIKRVIRERQRFPIFTLVFVKDGAISTFVGKTPRECASKMNCTANREDVRQSIENLGVLIHGPNYTMITSCDFMGSGGFN